jgi:hypothetical protein
MYPDCVLVVYYKIERNGYQWVAFKKEIPDMVVALHESKYSMRKLQNTFSELALFGKKNLPNMDKLYIIR